MQFERTDRVLMIIGKESIESLLKLCTYGYLLHMQTMEELSSIAKNNAILSFYSDWKPAWVVPFDQDLYDDVNRCAEQGLIHPEKINSNTIQTFSLTVLGEARWQKLMNEFYPEMTVISERISELQQMEFAHILNGKNIQREK